MREAKLAAANEHKKMKSKESRLKKKKDQNKRKDSNNGTDSNAPEEQKVEKDGTDSKNSSEEKKAPEEKKVAYERERLARIAENNAKLEQLRINNFKLSNWSPKKQTKSRATRKKDQQPGPGTVVKQRKSLRLSSKPSVHMGDCEQDESSSDDESSCDDDNDGDGDNDESSANDSEEGEADSRTFRIGATVFVVDANDAGIWELFTCKVLKQEKRRGGCDWWLSCNTWNSDYVYSTQEVFEDRKKAKKKLDKGKKNKPTNNDV